MNGIPLGAAAGGADMLQEILQRKFSQALALQQQKLAEQKMVEDRAYRQESLASLQGARDDAAAARQFAQQQAQAKQAEQETAQATTRNQGVLRAAIQGSQNMAGSGDPQGALGTRNALRVALASSGATGKEIPEEPTAPAPKLHAVTVPGPNGQPMHKLVTEEQMQQGVPGYKAPASPAAPRGLSPTAEANLTDKLAGEWTKTTAASREMERQFHLMKTGIDRFKQGDKNGGSQAVLVTFQKILDPTSVVRESEYARSAQGVSALQRMQGYAEQLAAGGAGVPEAALNEMVQTAEQFLAHSRQSTEGQRKRLQMFADKYGIPKELVFDDQPANPVGAGTKPPQGETPEARLKRLLGGG